MQNDIIVFIESPYALRDCFVF